MPYLQVELDVLNVTDEIGATCGLTGDVIGWGLMRLWAFCFRGKRETVHGVHVRGFFHGNAQVADSLVYFGFLEKAEDDQYRVKGARRYLRVLDGRKEAGSKGGKATAAAGKSKANLKQNKSFASEGTSDVASEGASVPASEPPKQVLRCEGSKTEALTPNTEHRTPILLKEEEAAAALKPKSLPADVAAAFAANASQIAAKAPPLHGGGAFFARAQESRRAAQLVTEAPPHPSKLSGFFSEAMLELDGDEERLWATYECFSEEDYWAEAKWPFHAFMKQWRNHVPRQSDNQRPAREVRRL
jgi:hypothetical protein